MLQEKYDGSVTKLIRSGEKSAEKLLDVIVGDFECFRDFATLSDGTQSVNITVPYL